MPQRPTSGPSFNVFEASIAEMQAAMKSGRTTSRAIVQQYLMRIATYEDLLHAAITVNPKALEEADALDRERAQGRVRGPLHGIPIALKDNIHTTDMRTTGGALAFEHLVPPYEATLTKNLRDAGAVIIAKTGMTELANYVTGGMPTNYNSVHGYGFNPYDPRRDPRNDGRPILQTGGSSSGIGTAANFWAGNVGTETSGSILSPSNQNMLAAVKPTVGRISRYGVIPITADQDTPGPMAKYVMDVAIMLGALEERVARSERRGDEGLHAAAGQRLREAAQGGRLEGRAHRHPAQELLRAVRSTRRRASGGGRGGGAAIPAQTKVMEEAIAAIKAAGATVIDVDIPSMLATDPKENLLTAGQSSVLSWGMKRDFNAWLASLGPAAPVKTLTELIEWNKTHERLGTIKYGQTLLDLVGRARSPEGQGEVRRGSRARHPRVRHQRHRRRREGQQPRRAAVPGPRQRGHRVEARLPDRARAVRHDPERARAAAAARGRARPRRCAPAAACAPLRHGRTTPSRPRPRATTAAGRAGRPGPAAARLRPEAAALRRRLHRSGVQRAEAAAARLRVRAGDEEAHAAAGTALRPFGDHRPIGARTNRRSAPGWRPTKTVVRNRRSGTGEWLCE